MKFLLSILLIISLKAGAPVWKTDINLAKTEAAKTHKLILLNFSGSDWCIPCMRLQKEIFASAAFVKYAETNLVLVNADFPRLRKNKLSKQQIVKNESMAEQYNSNGSFPLTLALDENGKVLREWEGYPNESPESFVNEIKMLAHGTN